MKKDIDTSLQFINNISYVVKNVETEKKEALISSGEELSNIVDYLIRIGVDQNISPKQLWLERIPAYINTDMLMNKYDYKKSEFGICPIIGEYDLPSKQEQKLLTLSFNTGNSIVYGTAGSGKENLITTMIYSSMCMYSPEEVNYYILDFGSESLKMFNDSPIVGDIIYVDDKEKIENLFKLLFNTIETRKDLFANYNGEFEYYCKNSGKKVPSIVVVINNFEAFDETYQDYNENLQQLTREGLKYGIYFVLTIINPNGIRFKLRSNFNQNFVLQQNNEADYSSILGNVQKKYPSKIFGRGLIKTDDVYEFQTSLVCEKENITEFIKEKSKEYRKKYNYTAKRVPILPRIVTFNDVKNGLNKNKFIVGISKEDLSLVQYSIHNNFINLVVSSDITIMENFVNSMIKQLEYSNNNLIVINCDEIKVNVSKNNKYYNDDFVKVFENLNNFIDSHLKEFKEKNLKKEFKNSEKITCIIIGVDNLKNKIAASNLNIESLFKNVKDLNLINYIFIDSIDKLKKLEYDSWYKDCVNNNFGIWIGNGIADQFSLKVNNVTRELRQEIGDNFCYVVKHGKPELVKYVEQFEEIDTIDDL